MPGIFPISITGDKMKSLLTLKAELKVTAKNITEAKLAMKAAFKSNNWADAFSSQDRYRTAKRDYRHKHIAYCLVRGKTYSEIENPKPDNKADLSLVHTLAGNLHLQIAQEIKNDSVRSR